MKYCCTQRMYYCLAAKITCTQLEYWANCPIARDAYKMASDYYFENIDVFARNYFFRFPKELVYKACKLHLGSDRYFELVAALNPCSDTFLVPDCKNHTPKL